MTNIQILVDNGSGSGFRPVDLPTDSSVKFSLYKAVQDFRDPLKATGAVSLPFTLPATNRNRVIFQHDDDKQKLGKFRGVYRAQMVLDNDVLLNGELTLNKIKANGKGFEVYIGQTQLLAPRLGDVVGQKKLPELRSMERIPFSGNSTVATSWGTNLIYPAAEVCYPFVARSFASLAPVSTIGGSAPAFNSGYESLGISHFCAAIVKAIFADAGYTVDGDIFNNEAFLKLAMLYSSSADQAWNYGTLAPMKSSCPPEGFGASFSAGVKNTYERQNDMVQVLTYGWQVYDGDLCESVGSDGVYTCKYSGVYTIRVSASHGYANGATGNGGFTTFRRITDNEFIPDDRLPSASAFGTVPDIQYLDVDTLAVGGSSTFTFSARLTAGEQYQVQRYVHFTSPTTAGSNSFLCYSPNEGNFFINSCDGPLLINPALFLPDMTQQVFLKGVFKLFNLYYQLDEQTKSVTLFGRDDFFQETLEDIVDLSRYLSLDAMDETPFTEAEVAATYVTWDNDENDYILNGTDYLNTVNGIVPEGTTVLPFAPLGYMKVTYAAEVSGATINGVDMIPAIIPYTDSIDTQVLSNVENSSTPGSWKPRLMLYHGNDWLNRNTTYSYPATGNVTVTLGRAIPAIPTVLGTYTGGGYPYTEYPPKATFFNVTNQPVYDVVINTQDRSFTLSGYTGSTIYTPPSPTFLSDVTNVPTLDFISLATNIDTAVNPLGFFSELYGNDLLIDSLSNYFQGVGHMDSVLWNKLTGRQIIRVGQDLFLLDSITNFDLNAKLATYRLYKLVSNNGMSNLPPPTSGSTSGGTGGNTIQYTSTMSATASCPTNTSGNTKTATATRSSYVSQGDADQKAYNAALQLATAQLVCTVTGWVGHGVVGAICSQGQSYGYGTTGTATYTSTISEIDAIQHANDLAYQDAVSKLVCHLATLAPDYIGINNLVSTVMGDFTPYPTSAAAQAYDFNDYTYYYAPNSNIIFEGYPVYVQSGGYFYLLADGYYPFRYTIGNESSTQWFLMQNGIVVDFVDNVGAGATSR